MQSIYDVPMDNIATVKVRRAPRLGSGRLSDLFSTHTASVKTRVWTICVHPQPAVSRRGVFVQVSMALTQREACLKQSELRADLEATMRDAFSTATSSTETVTVSFLPSRVYFSFWM